MEQPDFQGITRSQQTAWAAGDYSVIALSLMPAAELLVASADPHAGQRVLDVACGSGNVALVAARRYCQVSGVDYVPSLVERARARAAAEQVEVRFVEGDAQNLPFENAAFDYVFSAFGVMFAPDQDKAAHELARVCRPGGCIALASWIPEGQAGELFRIVSSYAPPAPAGLKPASRWGTERGLRELLGASVSSQRLERRTVVEHFRSVDHGVNVFRSFFGPVERAFARLDAEAQGALASDLAALFRSHNRAGDGTLAMPFEYLEAIFTRSN
jgi:ubiquinone/menaquinone biosynthesis C-methylase UbiE